MRIPEIQENPKPPPWGEYWEPIRRNRAHTRRLRKLGASKRRALITVVHNEPVFLPIWLGYYSRFFAPDDLYVIDNETTDGSTDLGGFVRIPGQYDPVASGNVNAVEKLQHELLEGEYDVVLVTDVDEIVTPTPEWGTLGEYMDEFAEWFVTCIGYELLHMIDREEPYDAKQADPSTSVATGSPTAPTTSRRSPPSRCHGFRASIIEPMNGSTTTPTCG